MALFSPPQPGKLGQVLPGILQGQASSEAHVAGDAKVYLLADLDNKKQEKKRIFKERPPFPKQ
jgi:hypothetical protein